MKLTRLQLVILTLIVLFGASLRLFRFGTVPISLFADEVDIGYQTISFRETGKDYFGNFLPLQFRSFSDVRTSLPIYATILVSYLPGVSVEQSVRLTPVIFSLATLILIFFFANTLWTHFKLDKPKGVLLPGHFAVFVLAIMPWHFTYSRTGFELSQLLFFLVLGLYLYLRYLDSARTKTLIFSLLLLGLTPMVYSTAKLAILGVPFLLWFLADDKARKNLLSRWYLLGILFLPLAILFISGGAGQRFSEIAIFTDPTIATEVNVLRQADQGLSEQIGAAPSLLTKIAHNKVTYIAIKFFNNLLPPLSTNFLFVQGDLNPRHAVIGWGMLLKTFLIFLVLGIYSLFNRPQKNLLAGIIVLALISILPAALTRDGADHSSRLFLLILSIILVSTLGLVYLSRYRLLLSVVVLLCLAESFFYFHDYFLHYPYQADTSFHYGVKEVVEKTKADGKPVVISPKYEPPLIFYLFYSNFPPDKFQSLLKNNELYRPIDKSLNLEGYQIGEEPVYIAFIANENAGEPYPLKATYYLGFLETVAIYKDGQKAMTPFAKSSSGLPIYYRIEAN